MSESTITITFSESVENHVGMEQIGTKANNGYSCAFLQDLHHRLTQAGQICEYHSLAQHLDQPEAAILIIRKYCTDPEILPELLSLPWDRKALMRGRVCNKHARYNLCFADYSQEANFEKGEGTVIDFKNVPHLAHLRYDLCFLLGEVNSKNEPQLLAEGNYYYDINKCYIGYHGDAERRKVIALRFGAEFELTYQWFLRSKPQGDAMSFTLRHGDMYIMSDIATGYNWRKSSIYTLRHKANKVGL